MYFSRTLEWLEWYLGIDPALSNHGIPNFAVVTPGVLYRGGQITTDDSWAYLQSLGVKTSVKLNFDDEGTDLGALKYSIATLDCHMPPKDIWGAIGKPDSKDIEAALTALQTNALWPVFLHCTHGRDRTGLMVGMYRVRHDGWSTDKAYKEMIKYGFRFALPDLQKAWQEFVERPSR